VLGITAVDPVGMDLLFERFLSEERGEWPDIDIDLPSGDRRESVIRHVYERYGPHGAAMTANVITWRSRLALREAAKAIGLPPEAADRAAKHAPGWGPFPIEARAGLEAGVRDAGLPDAPETRLLVDVALALRGLPRHLGQHSGGMIVAGGRLDEIVPLEPAAMPGRTVVQWDKDDCGDLGILKIDLLGLGMLRVLERTVPLVREHEGVEIDLAHLPKDDPITYRMLRQADTIGVFQLESRAQMATLPRMRPERFYDLVVEVALIRPGPIVGRMVNPYLERRAGREPVRYPHPSLEPILRRTLGVPLFQEQLMRVAMTAAGFTGGEAEELRRALGAKRSVERMAVMETKLRAGMKRLAIPDEAAEEIVRGISGFAMYGFPESHAASFALIAYASAFLHAHHPAAFGCALLDAWPMGFYHPATLVKDMQRHGVRVFPIDVFRSAWACGLEAQPTTTTTANASAITNANTTTNTNTRVGGPAVRLGLKFARGLREQAGRRIEAERRRAPFVSIADLARRTGLDAREIDGLAEIGALAGFGLERREAIWQAGRIARGDGPLWEGVEPEVPLPSPLAPMSPEDRTLADYRGTGLTVGVHPIGRRRLALSRTGVIRAAEIPGLPDGRWVKTAGIVIVRQRPATAKGFFFLTLEDETGLSNAVVTPDRYEAHRRLLVTAAALVVEGPLQNRDGVATVKVRRIEPLGRIANTPGSRDFR
jgi:error-prone DNA polymerase